MSGLWDSLVQPLSKRSAGTKDMAATTAGSLSTFMEPGGWSGGQTVKANKEDVGSYQMAKVPGRKMKERRERGRLRRWR